MLPLRDNAPVEKDPVVNWIIIILCVIVYFIQLAYPGGYQQSLDVWGEIPARILAGETVPGTSLPAWVTLFTAFFMHAGFTHLAGNMVILWIVGDNIEWVLGRLRYTVFYILCGLASGVATVFLGYESYEPGMGASGAIAGVMTAYLIIYPRARITSLVWFPPFGIEHFATGKWGFLIRNISAFWYVGGWLTLQILLALVLIGVEVHINAGIYAHVAGAIAGALLIMPMMLRERLPGLDHDAVTAEISAPIWGEDGDGGDGRPVLTPEEAEEQRRLSRLPGRMRGFQPEFRDYHADQLVAQGHLREALAHCHEMLALAERGGEQHRAEGYRALIERVEADVPREKPALPGRPKPLRPEEEGVGWESLRRRPPGW
jgi:membrane associated rhomboid family serine protease